MAKRCPVSPSNRAHLEHFVATVALQRAQPVAEAEVERILAALAANDAVVRARAAREVCPCRMPWPVFYRLRKAVARLRRDPSPLVRATALHVEVDARSVREREAIMAALHEREARRPSWRAGSRPGRSSRQRDA